MDTRSIKSVLKFKKKQNITTVSNLSQDIYQLQWEKRNNFTVEKHSRHYLNK